MTTETTETTAPSDPAESTEDVPYTYTINEDGSVVITLNGVPVEETTTTGTVVTNGGRLNLRTGAGMSYEIIDQLRCGEEVTVIGTEGDWYEVIVPEKTGFVHSDYLELMEDAKQNSEIDSAWLAMLMQLRYKEDTMELRTDPEFESKIPPLTDEEFQQLETNILADGVVISPIIVWNGVIVDGHNRYRIVSRHPEIPFTTCEKAFADRYDAIVWTPRSKP